MKSTRTLSWGIGLGIAALAAILAAFAWLSVIEPTLSNGRDHKTAVADFQEAHGALAAGVTEFEDTYQVTLVNTDLNASPQTVTVRNADGSTQTCILPSAADHEQRLPLADCVPE